MEAIRLEVPKTELRAWISTENPLEGYLKMATYIKNLKLTEKIYCPFPRCQSSTKCKSDLIDHLNLRHLRCFLYQCTSCEKTFLTKKLLRAHGVRKHEMPKIIKPASTPRPFLPDLITTQESNQKKGKADAAIEPMFFELWPEVGSDGAIVTIKSDTHFDSRDNRVHLFLNPNPYIKGPWYISFPLETMSVSSNKIFTLDLEPRIKELNLTDLPCGALTFDVRLPGILHGPLTFTLIAPLPPTEQEFEEDELLNFLNSLQ